MVLFTLLLIVAFIIQKSLNATDISGTIVILAVLSILYKLIFSVIISKFSRIFWYSISIILLIIILFSVKNGIEFYSRPIFDRENNKTIMRYTIIINKDNNLSKKDICGN